MNCLLRSHGSTLPTVDATISNRHQVKACSDTGANVSIVDPKALPQNTDTRISWNSDETLHVLSGTLNAKGSTTLDAQVGTTHVQLSNIVVSIGRGKIQRSGSSR